MANKTVTYHRPDGLSDLTLTVLKENSDGTLELGTEAGELKVGKCPVASEPKVGHATIPGVPAMSSAPDEDPDAAGLLVKTKAELVAVIEKLNAEPDRAEKILLTGKETKAELVQLITKATAPKPS